MNTITLSQPWASLLVAGKIHALPLPFSGTPGPVAIVAARSFKRVGIAASLAPQFLQFLAQTGFGSIESIPRGSVVGVVRCVRCDPILRSLRAAEEDRFVVGIDAEDIAVSLDEANFGEWWPGRFCWVFEEQVALAEPVPAQGASGVRVLRPEVEALVSQQLPIEAS